MNPAIIGTDWFDNFKDEFSKPYFMELKEKVQKEYSEKKCRPEPLLIGNAFLQCPYDEVKVVMIGQDPYPSDHAHGLAFSSLAKSYPFSLRVVFKEIQRTIYPDQKLEELFPTSDLTSWAKQGVLLLNTILTVEDKKSGSHRDFGWELFTAAVIRKLITYTSPIVFVAWGKDAQNNLRTAIHKEILGPNIKILTAGHPAAAAYGRDTFSGCDHFNQINEFLVKKEQEPIIWRTSV